MLRNLDWNETLKHIENFATSGIAKNEIQKTEPLPDAKTAQERTCEVIETQKILGHGVRPHFRSLDLFSFWFDRLSKQATLKPLEFRDVRNFCLEWIALGEVLGQVPEGPFLKQLRSNLPDAREPLSAIDQILTPEGDVRTDASEKLFQLYRDKQEKEREIRQTLDRLVKAHDMESYLQDKFVTNREGRWVLPIRSGMRHSLDGIIHDMSQTKQTVFMEPQAVVEVNNALRRVEIEIVEEVERLLKQLSLYLASRKNEIQASQKIMLNVDIRLAQAQFAQLIQASVPRFSNALNLRDLRHPLLSAQLGAFEVIPNTVRLADEDSVLLLSGPNAGGKTVLLKSIGLAAHMARCGLPICAGPDSQIPFFNNIVVAIGDSQSVDKHLSTFAAHLQMLSSALNFEGTQTLVLVDEICGSTDPEEGAALARSFVESYAKNRVFGVITSHLGPLKTGWAPGSGVMAGSMDFDDRSSRPTYHFIMGAAGRSLALKTAQTVGVPKQILDRAFDVLGPAAKAREEALTMLEHERAELTSQKQQYQKMANESRDLRMRYSQLIEKFKSQRDEWMKRAIEKAEKKIEAVIEELKRDQLRTRSVGDFKARLPQIVKASARSKVETAEDFARLYPAGNAVFVKSIGQDGVVQGQPNAKGEVPILSNSMRLMIHWNQLSEPKSPQNPTSQLARKSGVINVALRNEDREIDLRGQRVDEALEILETELDKAAHNQEDRVKVIHGHGTEALKKAIRAYFSRSVYVKKWIAGDPNSGGDGITWVELGD